MIIWPVWIKMAGTSIRIKTSSIFTLIPGPIPMDGRIRVPSKRKNIIVWEKDMVNPRPNSRGAVFALEISGIGCPP